MTLDEWRAGQAGLGVGLDGYFATLGGKVLNSKVGVSSLGLGSFQEVMFHGRLRGGANKGSGRVDSPNLGNGRHTAGRQRWLVTGVVLLGFGSLAP